MTAPHEEQIDECIARLDVDPSAGLTPAEAQARLLKDGPNELPSKPGPSALRRFFAQFANPIVLTLLAAAVIATGTAIGTKVPGAEHASFLVRFGDAIAIGLIVVLNAVLGFYQEKKAQTALEALKRMQAPSARVWRNKETCIIPAAEVVAGDILLLESGDAIAADARILSSVDLATQESSLTGESTSVDKRAKEGLAADTPMGDRENMLFVGTLVVRGRGRAVIVATAGHTELGKLSALMNESGEKQTPLEVKLDTFGKRVLWTCLTLSALLFGYGMIRGLAPWHALLLEAVSLAVAAIPEGLPAITTITLALGMQRMAKRGAIVRRLSAVETLGSATVICSDKTGTLTQNEMTVREIYADSVSYDVTGTGYSTEGAVATLDGKTVQGHTVLSALALSSAICNNARLDRGEDGAISVLGDPTEGALLTMSEKLGYRRPDLDAKYTIVHEQPFDSDRKRMSVVVKDSTGARTCHVKGSADVLLECCTRKLTANGIVSLDDTTRKEIASESERMSRAAMRVLAVAYKEVTDDGGSEDELVFLGLTAMIDPPRVGVREAVAACEAAKIRTVMITGDHKLTAISIAEKLGMWDERAIAITGPELDKLSKEQLENRVDLARVFARVTAEQKLRIVRAFRATGHVVAMTGDGVNDAPALREADIGIAMGKNGTDVAREAADMVLADDNFATIVDAIREGRAVYRNIQKFIFFLLSSNAGLLVCVFGCALFPGLLSLRPLMILWINLVTNGLPALALGVDPPDPDQMNEAPRRATDELLGKREYLGILAVGIFMGGLSLASYFFPWSNAPKPTDAPLYARAFAFSFLALSPMFHALNCRSATRSILGQKPIFPRILVLSLVVSTAIHLVTILIPTLRDVFGTFLLTPAEWILLFVLSFAIVPATELLKFLQRAGIVGKDLGPMSRQSQER